MKATSMYRKSIESMHCSGKTKQPSPNPNLDIFIDAIEIACYLSFVDDHFLYSHDLKCDYSEVIL